MPAVNETDLANAEVELAQAKLYQDVSRLGSEGLAMAEVPTEKGFNNPSLLRIIYHAFDGRAVPIPDYMAPKRLAERFPNETWVPADKVGQRVWFLEPQDVTTGRQELKCLLHSDQEADVKTWVQASGFNSGRCTKSNIPNPYSVEKHMELKHKDEWRAMNRHRDNMREQEYRDSQREQTLAFTKLAEALTARTEGNGKTS